MKKSLVFLSIVISILSYTTSYAKIVDPVMTKMNYKVISEKDVKLIFQLNIDEGWYIYAPDCQAMGTTPASIHIINKGVKVDKIISPIKSLSKIDSTMMERITYYVNSCQFETTIHLQTQYKDNTLQGYLEYGACNNNMCIPPTKYKFSIKTDIQKQLLSNTGNKTIIDTIEENGQHEQALSTTSMVSVKETSSHSSLSVLLLGFLAGLLALLTPCVWPTIPMTISFFLKKSKSLADGRKNALLFALSIIVIYLSLGIIITLIAGANALNALSTNAIFNVLLFLILVVFGISLIGGFEITLPASLANKLDNKANALSGTMGIFLMALTLSVVSFSCTCPIVGALLVELVVSSSWLNPTLGMLGFSLGLAIPFSIFALIPSYINKLPKSGIWMSSMKIILGFVEIGFSLKFLSVADLAYGWGLISRETFIVIWLILSVSLTLILVYNIIRYKSSRLFHVMFALFSTLFSVYLYMGLSISPLTQISAFLPPAPKEDDIYTDFYEALQMGRQQEKLLFINFTGYGCVNCREMEGKVFSDSIIANTIKENFINVELYVDDKTPLPKVQQTDEVKTKGEKWSKLQRERFSTNSQPYYVIYDASLDSVIATSAYNTDKETFLKFLKTSNS